MKMERRPDRNVDSFRKVPQLPALATPPVSLPCAMSCKSCSIWRCAAKVRLGGRSINVSHNALSMDDREVGHVQGRQSKITPLSVLAFRIDNVVPNLIRPTLLPGLLRNPDDTRNRRCRGGVGHAEEWHKRTHCQFNMARVDLGRGAKRADVIRNGSYGAPRSAPTATGVDSVGQASSAFRSASGIPKVHEAQSRP